MRGGKFSSVLERLVWLGAVFFVVLLSGIRPYPHQLSTQFLHTRTALENESFDAAKSSLLQIVEQQPWRNSLWDLTGRTALNADDPQTAIAFLAAAKQSGRISSEGVLALGSAYEGVGEFYSAIHTWEEALNSLDPSHENTSYQLRLSEHLLGVYQKKGNYAGAIQALHIIKKLDPDNAKYRYLLGVLLAAEEPESALTHLLQALELDEELGDIVRTIQKNLAPDQNTNDEGAIEPAYIYLNAGRALAWLGEWNLAARVFEQAVLINPDYGDAWAFLAEAYAKTGRPSRSALETALTLSPDGLPANLFSGIYWKRQGEFATALRYFEASDEIEPDNPVVQIEIGDTYFQIGDSYAALAYYQRAALLTPNEPTYWLILSRFSLETGMQIEDIGIAAARRALLLKPGDVVALDLLGYGYLLLNEPLLAARFLSQALEENARYAPAHLHTGMLALSQNDMTGARESLNQAALLAPDTPTAIKAIRILEQLSP